MVARRNACSLFRFLSGTDHPASLEDWTLLVAGWLRESKRAGFRRASCTLRLSGIAGSAA